MTHPTQAHINLAALRYNIQIVRQCAPQQKVVAVLKANAYGHGSVEAAKALPDVDAFGVAFLSEALTLRQAGITQPINVFQGPLHAQDLADACEHQIDLVIHRPGQVELLETTAYNSPIVVWLKLNTGMNRLGFSPEVFDEMYQRLKQNPNVAEVRLMTHLACADETENDFTQRQVDLFDRTVGALKLPVSIANSGGVLAWPATHRDWIRCGIMLYGASPFADWRVRETNLKPAMTLKSVISATHDLQPGDSVGYSGTWVARKACRIAVAAIGYGDGYPRCLPSGTPVLVNGERASLAGRVSMDMITIDITSNKKVKVGDEVILWGEQLPVEEIAELANTIPYELYCGVTARVPRIYSES